VGEKNCNAEEEKTILGILFNERIGLELRRDIGHL
jgi:hypothetical protein